MALVRAIYEITRQLPSSEIYGLTAQMRRAAVSIPSNIAEDAARECAKEFAHFLSIAKGSLSELETQILIAQELGYFRKTADILDQTDRVSCLLAGLHKSVKT